MPELFVFITFTIFVLVSWGLFSLCQNLMETK
jgi:hypothetical protein